MYIMNSNFRSRRLSVLRSGTNGAPNSPRCLRLGPGDREVRALETIVAESLHGTLNNTIGSDEEDSIPHSYYLIYLIFSADTHVRRARPRLPSTHWPLSAFVKSRHTVMDDTWADEILPVGPSALQLVPQDHEGDGPTCCSTWCTLEKLTPKS